MQAIGICQKCSRVLKNPESVSRGFGPQCWLGVRPLAGQVAISEAALSNFECRMVDGVLVIIDLDIGGMSVTNNIDAILRQISEEQGVDLIKHAVPIVYRDSEGHFDGVRASKKGARFYPLSRQPVLDVESAVNLLKKKVGVT